MPVNDKKSIRKAVRQAFPGREERDRQSAALCAQVLAWERYRQARVIGGYMPMAHEADVTPILLDALAAGKKLVLPRCGRPPEMSFHRVSDLAELTCGAYGLLEPPREAENVPPEEIDLLITPLEAIDRRGMRLGKGGGYYDCLLAERSIFTLGMALDHQWAQTLPAESWDRPLRAAAGTDGIILF